MENLNEFLNSYNEVEHFSALNNQNIYVSYSGDYKENPINHVHNSCELLFIEQGGGEYKIRGQQYHIEKNGVLIIGGTDPHSRRFTQVPCIRYGLTVLPAFLQSLPIINGYMNVYRTHSPEEAIKLQGIDDVTFGRMVSIIWQLREEIKDNGQGKGDMVYALLLEMTIILNRLLHLEKQNISGMYKTMSDIKNYIDFHYAENLSLEELSRIFYLQPNTISKNFRKAFEKNINSYIHSVRVSNAVRLLENQDISITELSEVVGYSSVNTFLRQFRESLGISPLQYKKQFERYKEDVDTTRLMWNIQEKKKY